ncbi:SRPBCC domain-containing protein [uncultured Leifsonia sp.]|uniref:SRPBCC domain-containing protein n=1 Tax=uncultured Leifsonia sp. TaxID=340359 RepID=UPI0028D44CD7|nr:SRPBCC domain-containing protein [uncultured Leifsonia sp.]
MSLWGEIALDGARRVVTVEREYPAGRAELWSALTEPRRLERWIGRYTAADDGFRLEMGGPGTDAVVTGRVLACEPERRILVSWRFSGDGEREADTELEATIAETAEGRVLLTLTHRRVQAVTASVYGAGWQDVLTRLARALGAERSPQDVDGYAGEAADPAAFDAALGDYRRSEAALVAGDLDIAGDRGGVRLRRVLDAPPAAVWDALTLPDRIGRWLWPVVEWPDDPARERRVRLGDVMRLGDANVEGGVQELEVLALEPERHLRFSWGDAAVSIRLQDDEDGTLLTLVQDPIESVMTYEGHSGAGRLRSAPDFAAGWHSLIDQLTLLLSGLTVPEPDRLWEAAYLVYSESLARPHAD